jgi:hypothetical protein
MLARLAPSSLLSRERPAADRAESREVVYDDHQLHLRWGRNGSVMDNATTSTRDPPVVTPESDQELAEQLVEGALGRGLEVDGPERVVDGADLRGAGDGARPKPLSQGRARSGSAYAFRTLGNTTTVGVMVERMTRASFEAGEPCPGCGVALQGQIVDLCQMEIDALESMRRGPIDPTGLFASHVANLRAERLVHDVGAQLAITQLGRRALTALRRDGERYTKQHGQCGAGRQRIAGGPLHCMKCCPPPPLSDSQIAQIATILRSPGNPKERTSR